jgi:hypothetical protein
MDVQLSTAGRSVVVDATDSLDGSTLRNANAETFRLIWSMIRSGEVLVMEAKGRRGRLLPDGASVMPPEACARENGTACEWRLRSRRGSRMTC